MLLFSYSTKKKFQKYIIAFKELWNYVITDILWNVKQANLYAPFIAQFLLVLVSLYLVPVGL